MRLYVCKRHGIEIGVTHWSLRSIVQPCEQKKPKPKPKGRGIMLSGIALALCNEDL